MIIKYFQDMIAWKLSHEMAMSVYQNMSKCHDYGFRDQFQRAAVSVMNNIAEGFEMKNGKQFRRYLLIANGSCGEVKSMSILAVDLGYVSTSQSERIYGLCKRISELLMALIRSMPSSNPQ